MRGWIRFYNSSPFCGMFISIDNRVGIPTVTFSQLHRKQRSRLCRDALLYEIRTVVMFVDQMMNNKGGCGNVTFCYARCWIGVCQRGAKKSQGIEFAEIAHVHSKADCVGATSSCKEERPSILSFHQRHSFSPPHVNYIQFLFSLWGGLPLQMLGFNLTEVILLLSTWQQSFFFPFFFFFTEIRKPFIDLILCSIPDDMQQRTDIFHSTIKKQFKNV